MPIRMPCVQATLANDRREGEALTAYARALELRPRCIRLRVNIGIAQQASASWGCQLNAAPRHADQHADPGARVAQ